MKKILYILLLSVISLTTAKAGVSFTKVAGDSAYSQSCFDDAIKVYEAVIENEGGSVEVYYNLGNAYFRNNMLGKAILNYERALRIDPTDKDAMANLEYALAMTKDEIAEQYEVFFITWFKSVVNSLTLNSWAVTAVVSFMLLLLLMLLFFFNRKAAVRKVSLSLAVVSFIVVIFANIAAISLYSNLNDNSEAIVMREEAYLKSTPDNSGTDLVKIHEGRKVKIVDDTMREWKEVELEDGTVGWLQAVVIERI